MKYLFDYRVKVASKFEERQREFSAESDALASIESERILRKAQEEFPFAPPSVKGVLYRLEPVHEW